MALPVEVGVELALAELPEEAAAVADEEAAAEVEADEPPMTLVALRVPQIYLRLQFCWAGRSLALSARQLPRAFVQMFQVSEVS